MNKEWQEITEEIWREMVKSCRRHDPVRIDPEREILGFTSAIKVIDSINPHIPASLSARYHDAQRQWDSAIGRMTWCLMNGIDPENI